MQHKHVFVPCHLAQIDLSPHSGGTNPQVGNHCLMLLCCINSCVFKSIQVTWLVYKISY